MNQLKIFVSSTCYDLMQIRSDLFDFISGIGYQPVLSEYTSFPIDPDNDTIDNCIQNVATSDVLILVLGGKYGHTIDTGKSITNTEYLYAKQMGIPIYVFIYKPLITILPVWSQNKEADFSQTVDTPKVFEFVEELRSKNKSWCFEFEKAQDITNVLKIQLSHLFKQSLELRKKYRVSDQPSFYQFLSPTALNLVLKKELGFEYLFFAQVLKDELEKHEHLKLDLEYKILVACTNAINDNTELLAWLGIQLETINHFISSLNSLFDNALKEFIADPGVPSDLKGLYYVGCSIGQLFKEMILLSIAIKSTLVDDNFVKIRDSASEFLSDAIEQIWSFPNETILNITESIRQYKEFGGKVNIQCTLTIRFNESASDTFHLEIERLRQSLKTMT